MMETSQELRPAPTREQITECLQAFLLLTGAEAQSRLHRDAAVLLHPNTEAMLRQEAAAARTVEDLEYAQLLEARADELARYRARGGSQAPSGEETSEATKKAELAFLLIELQTMQSIPEGGRDAAWLDRRIALCEAVLERLPEHANRPVWATIQGALGNALSALGEITGDANLFRLAEAAHRKALNGRPRATDPDEWAKSQDNLGVTLTHLGELTGDPAVLARAQDAFVAALEQRSGTAWANERAGILVHLGIALRLSGGADALARSEAALREALTLLDRDHARIDWIAAKNSLGETLHIRGVNGDPGALDEAETHYREALRQCDRDRWGAAWGAIQHNLGAVLEAIGDRMGDASRLRAAEAAYVAALSARERASAPIEWAKSQNNLGNLEQRIGELDGDLAALRRAETAYGAAMEVLGHGAARRLRGMTRHNLGGLKRAIAAMTGEIDEVVAAEALYREALQDRPRADAPRDWASTQNELGATLRTLGEANSDLATLRRSEAACRDALIERTRSKWPLDWAVSQTNLGATLAAIGEHVGDIDLLREAEASHRRALEVLDRSLAPMDWAMVHNNLGNVLSRLGDWLGDAALLREGETALRHAIEERTRARAPMEWAATQNNLGVLLEGLGALTGEPEILLRAAAAYREALKERARHRKPTDWAGTQNNLGAVLLRLSQVTGDETALREAEAALRKALDLEPRDRVPAAWARTQNNLGAVLATRGEREGDASLLERAVTAYRAALQERTIEKSAMDWAETQNNLGAALVRLGDLAGDEWRLQEAVTAYRAALNVRTLERVPIEWAKTTYNLARALDRLGVEGGDEQREAEAAYRRALAAFDASGDEENRQITAVALVRSLTKRKAWEDALAVIDASLVKSDAAMADAARGRDGVMRVIEITSELHSQKSLCLWRRPRGDPLEALAAAEVGRTQLLADALETNALSPEQIADPKAGATLASALARRRTLRHRLGSAKGADGVTRPEPSATDRAQLQSELRHVADLVATLRRQHAPLRSSPRLEPEEIASIAPENGAFVLPVLTDHDAFAFVLSRELDRPSVLDLPGLDRREVAAHLWRTDGGWLRIYRDHFVINRGRDRALAGVWRRQMETTFQWLWKVLMAPIHHRLSQELGLQPGAPVTLSPPGLLGALPLHAAGSSREALCFDDHWTVTYTPSIRVHLLCRDRQRHNLNLPPKLLAVIAPFLADGTEPLPAAEREKMILQKYFAGFDPVILSHREATLAAVVERLPHATHFHVSSHGGHDPTQPLRSGVRLAGGNLGMDVLRDLELPSAPLVVLAACESGIAEIERLPEEFIGLPLGFLRAGAAGVIASLWPVRDEAAAEVVGRFYEAHIDGAGGKPLSAPAALRAARAALRKDSRFSSPEHWAAFTMIA